MITESYLEVSKQASKFSTFIMLSCMNYIFLITVQPKIYRSVLHVDTNTTITVNHTLGFKFLCMLR